MYGADDQTDVKETAGSIYGTPELSDNPLTLVWTVSSGAVYGKVNEDNHPANKQTVDS